MCGVLILGVRGLFGLERRENHVRWMEGTCRCVSGASTIELGGFGCFEGAVGVRRQVCWAWDCFWRRVAWAWRGPAFSRVVSVLVSGQRAFDVKRERTLPCLLG